jgi:ABC-type protease/lipase transport system fused ATPase/permease subunit
MDVVQDSEQLQKLPNAGGNFLPALRKAQPIQLTWVNITITAMPAVGRCKPQGALVEKRVIIENVSGNVIPGEFLAIIGASGKLL